MICKTAGKSAADLMAVYAEPMLRDWIRASKAAAHRGDHRPSRDWLLHAGSIDPLPETQRGSGTTVVVVNNPLPGLPGSAPLTIDVLNAALPDAVPIDDDDQ
jgi:hypothetical protein